MLREDDLLQELLPAIQTSAPRVADLIERCPEEEEGLLLRLLALNDQLTSAIAAYHAAISEEPPPSSELSEQPSPRALADTPLIDYLAPPEESAVVQPTFPSTGDVLRPQQASVATPYTDNSKSTLTPHPSYVYQVQTTRTTYPSYSAYQKDTT